MIDRTTAPVGWSLMVMGFAEAHDHLGQLVNDLANSPEYTEAEFLVDLGHIYAHLKRAWYRRNCPNDLLDAEWELSRAFPSDIEPIA